MSSRIALSVDDGLATLRLTRPEAGNAIGPEWVRAFAEAVSACVEERAVRAVLICAEGRVFTVGGDLKHFASRIDDLGGALEEIVPSYHRSLGALAEASVPVVAALGGPIAGGGLGLAFCSDIVLITPAVRFVSGFARLGLSGDGAGTWYLPRLVGPRLAAEMSLLGRELDAEEAVRYGLATRIVPADELESEAVSTARTLATGPTIGLGRMRQLLRGGWDRTLAGQLEAETEAMLETGRTEDAREGVEAFVERRAPRFTGR